jgi:RNA polymerase sigma-70 factor (TIGR02960 family)
VHCYRMLGNYEDAQDLTQETFLRAWNKRESFKGHAALRTWLYRIATNACLDFLEKRDGRTSVPFELPDPGSELPYLQPYPDRMLPEDPQESVVARETIELAFIVAVQQLPPQGRAALLLRDVLGWSAADSATLLDVSIAAMNSSLQRARAVLQEHLPADRSAWSAEYEGQERELVERYVEVHEHYDEDKLLALLAENARWAMPPDPVAIAGRSRMYAAWREGGFGTPEFGELRCVVTRANRQPAVGIYQRRVGEENYRPMAIDVLRMVDGVVGEIVTFVPGQFAALGLPAAVSYAGS